MARPVAKALPAMKKLIPKLKLANGNMIPTLGHGSWRPKEEPSTVSEAAKTALQNGYRHFDCACYHATERVVGETLHKHTEDGAVTREDLFVTSKIMGTRLLPDDVRPSIETSLQRLGLEYLDLYLIHWPNSFKWPGEHYLDSTEERREEAHYLDTYKAMEDCYEAGLVRNIGVSNFNQKQVQNVLDNCRIHPVNNQVQIRHSNLHEDLIDYCQSRDISVTAYSPTGYSDWQWALADYHNILDEQRMLDLTQKYNKSAWQIIQRWLLQKGVIVILQDSKTTKIQDSVDVFSFELDRADMDLISELNINTNGRQLT